MTDTLIKEALNLSGKEKAILIDLLSDSLLTVNQKKNQQEWAKESQRRYDEYRAGKHEAVDYVNIKRNEIDDSLSRSGGNRV